MALGRSFAFASFLCVHRDAYLYHMYSRYSGPARISFCCFSFHSGPVWMLPGPVKTIDYFPLAPNLAFVVQFGEAHGCITKRHTFNQKAQQESSVLQDCGDIKITYMSLLRTTGHDLREPMNTPVNSFYELFFLKV